MNHLHISKLDPLKLDSFFEKFPSYNMDSQVKPLLCVLEELVAKNTSDSFSENESHAATRDIGMILSALRKLGVQACEQVAGLGDLLVQLSKKTKMVPRDTSYHYGPWNPTGARERRFTKFSDEDGLINAVRVAIPGIEEAITVLNSLRLCPLESPEFTSLSLKASEGLNHAVIGIGETIRKTDPYVFSHELRPFFDPVIVNGTSYIGAGGGQIPLFVVDLLLWGSELNKSSLYAKFIQESIPYLPKHLQDLCFSIIGSPSLVKIAATSLNKNSDKQRVQVASTESIRLILKTLIKFRKPHYQLAKKTLSAKNRGAYKTGSAGYTNELTSEALKLTLDADDKLAAIVSVNGK